MVIVNVFYYWFKLIKFNNILNNDVIYSYGYWLIVNKNYFKLWIKKMILLKVFYILNENCNVYFLVGLF